MQLLRAQHKVDMALRAGTAVHTEDMNFMPVLSFIESQMETETEADLEAFLEAEAEVDADAELEAEYDPSEEEIEFAPKKDGRAATNAARKNQAAVIPEVRARRALHQKTFNEWQEFSLKASKAEETTDMEAMKKNGTYVEPPSILTAQIKVFGKDEAYTRATAEYPKP